MCKEYKHKVNTPCTLHVDNDMLMVNPLALSVGEGPQLAPGRKGSGGSGRLTWEGST
jgi:hypothetical protein